MVEATGDRGRALLLHLYRSNLEPILETWGNHRADFHWLEERVVYGMFLSDARVISQVENEVMVIAGIMCQDLPGPTMWHIRGLRRLGVDVESAEAILECVRIVARWAERDTTGRAWMRAADVSIEEEKA